MQIKIQTLTPLWTGGVDGKMDRIHETGIIGSMRWWYEAIVRGLGWACDPTSDNKCRYNPRDIRSPKEQLCPACYVFGATGWRRQFRLEVIENAISDASIQRLIKANRRYTYTNKSGKKHTRTPKWYFETPKAGQISIEAYSLSQGFQLGIIEGLLQFMIEWTALGAKAQMGFGVMQPISDRLDANVFLNCIKGIDNNHNSNYLPSLQNIFLAKIQLQNANDRDIFDLKYDLRQLFAVDDNLRHFIMGTIKGQRTASKIKVSRPYDNGLIRVWGWIPEKASVYSEKWNRESILQCIYGHLDSYYSLKVWREMSSVRDKVDKNQEDPRIFLKSLLKVAVSE